MTVQQTLQAFGAEYLRLVSLLGQVEEAQWQAGKTPTPREDSTERSKNLTSDPTPTITADGRRLALRLEVIKAERELDAGIPTLSAISRHLTEALDKWQGS